MSASMLAIDLGAESGRAILGRFDGTRVELHELHRFPTTSVRLPDGLYWDALGLYADVLAGLAASVQHGPIRSVGIDSWAVDFGLLDHAGRLIANPLSHRDGRGAAAIEGALASVPFAELYAITGIQLLPINTVFQLLSNPCLDRAATMLLIPDLLSYWLTGERAAEETNASTTQLLDARSGRWSSELIRRLGLPESVFPGVVAPATVRGLLLDHAARASGVAPSVPIVSVASHDTASAVVATPLASPGAAFISSGTWSLVGVECEGPVLTEAAREANLTNERGFGGTTRLLKNVTGLWLIQECRRAWRRAGFHVSNADLGELARRADTAFLFDPDLPGLLAPGDMPARISAMLGSPAQGPEVLARSIFESLACKYRLVLEQLEAVTESAIDVVNVVGGGAQNTYLCQLTADVTGRSVVAGPVEASALGNVLVQMHASGAVAGLDQMRQIVTESAPLKTYLPDSHRGRWEDLYGRFTEVARPQAVVA